MSLEVATQDCSALTEAQIEEMLTIEGGFGLAEFQKAQADWVLCTLARIDGKLHGVTFSTLERIGGTPCVLIGLMTIKRTGKRDAVLKGLMGEAYHRALMAFPDEDVVVGSRFVSPDGVEAFKSLTDIIPRTGHRADGEQRAWGKRLARRFGVDSKYDGQTFVVASDGQSGYLDFESSKPEKISENITALFSTVNAKKGGVIIIHGWTMAESLVKLGARS
ncbi:MAG: hypothetical protein ACK45J_04610 [Acidimicrobiaceae bacterium]|jgi:hypothetical protein|nr:hypothetical protein [Ilumatobacteraceae bacterium]